MKKPPLLNNHIYHVFNRGVEKRDTFLDASDYSYMVHDFFVLNDKRQFQNIHRSFNRKLNRKSKTSEWMEVQPPSIQRKRDPLVEILVFTLMPNHFHLLLRQVADNGISKFMQKLSTSITMRFNKKYDRVGSLFQGRFKAVLVEKDAHFMYLPHYIHLNPLALLESERSVEQNVADDTALQMDGGSTSIHLEEKMRFLENYKWSSFPDYVGRKNFPSVTQREFLLEYFGGEKAYGEQTASWLKNKEREAEALKQMNTILLDFDD